MGLPISAQQIKEMEAHAETIDFEKAAQYEKTLHHDVMAHIHAFADQCPSARGIIHLGATSAYVTDNGDLIQIRGAIELLQKRLVHLIEILKSLSLKWSALPTLGYTHLKPAQPTTVGKRICMWLQDFYLDLQDLLYQKKNMAFLGLKGATGTQASFMALFHQDSAKVQKLEELIAQEMGFHNLFLISGQTYTRKQDMRILSVLAGLASSSHKCATDLRLLAHLGEMEENFEETQVGSSAMPHKRNPILAERVCSLARYLIALNENPAYNHATQWLERSLDDSANRRLSIPEAFLTADALLLLLTKIFSKLQVYPKVIDKHMQHEIPFLAMENLLMCAVKKGADRQKIHERLRYHSQKALKKLKEEGTTTFLLKEIEQDKEIGLSQAEIASCIEIDQFIGRAQEQVELFIASLG